MAWTDVHNKFNLKRNYPQEWPGLISRIENQGWCSSSWALATAAVAGDRFLALILLHITIIIIIIVIIIVIITIVNIIVITFSITIITINLNVMHHHHHQAHPSSSFSSA